MKLVLVAALVASAAGFVAPPAARPSVVCHGFFDRKPAPTPAPAPEPKEEKKGKGFFAEMDNFIDDAFSRKLGNGAAFYGKRQSSFYGENDEMKKKKGEKNWEFNGPKGGGYYVLDSEGRPVSRRRGAPLWDKRGGRE